MIYFISSGGPECQVIFHDLKSDSRLHYIDSPYVRLNSLINYFRQLHNSAFIARRINLPLKRIWNKTYSLEKIDVKQAKKSIFIFVNTSVQKYELSYLKDFQRKYSATFYLFMLDSVETERGKEVAPYIRENIFKKIFTFDKKDSKKYGFQYWIQPLSKILGEEEEILFDLYYLGRSKGRQLELNTVAESVKGLRTKLLVFSSESGWHPEIKTISKSISYLENVTFLKQSNVILEVVQKNQSGNTLRYQEAVIYNKKLLTNNADIVNLDFYNPKYMKVFSDVNNIDVDWIRQQEEVNYHYSNEFSSIRFIDYIESDNERGNV
ncbi:TPA: hypothetical protein ACGOVM_001736 [Streptococcus suis]